VKYREFFDEATWGEETPLEYEIMFWNGKERVPLVVEAVDGRGQIILGDARRFMSAEELKTYEDSRSEFEKEFKRRVEEDSKPIRTEEEARAYIADVASRVGIDLIISRGTTSSGVEVEAYIDPQELDRDIAIDEMRY
jgi:hypothetical protein